MCGVVVPLLPLTRPLSFPDRDMKLWHGLVMAAVSLVLQACLLAAVNYLLSRHLGNNRAQFPTPSITPQGPSQAGLRASPRGSSECHLKTLRIPWPEGPSPWGTPTLTQPISGWG